MAPSTSVPAAATQPAATASASSTSNSNSSIDNDNDNDNDPTDTHYMTLALSLAQQSPPRPTNYRVGAVLVRGPCSSRHCCCSSPAPASTSASAPAPADASPPLAATATATATQDPRILATGYTLSLPGNTHAEQNCIAGLAAAHGLPEARAGEALPLRPRGRCACACAPPPSAAHGALAPASDAAAPACPCSSSSDCTTITLYTTMEPCVQRLSGATACVDRLLALRRRDGSRGVDRVVCGAGEPDVFVVGNAGRARLEGAGVRVEYLRGWERRVVGVATAGHARA